MSTAARNPKTMDRRPLMAGLSLIELMVSVVIGLLLVIGATTVYVNSRKTADIDETIARLHETARYALSIIEADTRMANYWGLNKDGAEFVNKLSQTTSNNPVANLVGSTGAASCGADFAVDVESYIEGSNNSFFSTATTCSAHYGSVASADTLVIRRASSALVTADSKKLQVCSNRNHSEIVRATSCAGDLRNLVVNAYYIDQKSNQNSEYPSLRRKWLSNDSTDPTFRDDEVIPGIEDMQIQLGWDSTGTAGNVTRYLNPGDALLATGQIVSVRVWLLVRAETPDRTFTDTRTYEYGDRSTASTTNDLTSAGAAGKAYKPSDNFRRLLVSRTFFVRNVLGT